MVDILSAMESSSPATTKEKEKRRSGSHMRRFSLRSRNPSLDRSYTAARNQTQPQMQTQMLTPSQSKPTLPVSTPTAAPGRTVRLKIHYEEDTRYIILSASTTFNELLTAIGKKFKLREEAFVLKTRDEEGDLITISDQDDLEAAYLVCVELAKGREDEKEYGRLEIWVNEARMKS